MGSKHLIAFALLLLAGCNYTVNKNPGAGGGTGGGNTAASAMSFANVQAKVLKTSCLPCHASPRNAGGVNVDTWENVFAKKDAIRAAVASGAMPPAGMSDDKKQLLISWIDAGALLETPPGTEVPKPGDPQPSPAPSATPTDDHGDDDRDDDDDDDHGGRQRGLTWNNVNARVIQTSCKGCHSAPANRGGVNLETYENVFAKRSAIKRAVASGEMPPRGMSDDKKDLLIAWIDAGAPRGRGGENPRPTPRATPEPIATPMPTPEPTPAPMPTPEPVACAPDFAEVYSQIIEPKCTGCHSSGGGAGGIELDKYELVFANRLQVREAVSERFMPPRRPLEDPQIELLVDWVDAGAPEKKPENCSNLITEVGT